MKDEQITAAKELAERLKSAEDVLSLAKEYLDSNGMIYKGRDVERAIDKHHDTYHKEPVDETFEKFKDWYYGKPVPEDTDLQTFEKVKAIFQTTEVVPPKPTDTQCIACSGGIPKHRGFHTCKAGDKETPKGTEFEQWERLWNVLKPLSDIDSYTIAKAIFWGTTKIDEAIEMVNSISLQLPSQGIRRALSNLIEIRDRG